MDYQKTLNLPQTDFAMKAGLTKKEPQILKQWQDDQIYARIRAKAKGKPSFILHDGPPYANGHIHIGHALNKILKDIIVRYKTMKGFDAQYVPGWDCHGLPIEHQLLKDMKAKKEDFDTVIFRKQAHDYAMKFVGIQREEFKRLGIWGEWENPYLTLSPEYEYWILKSLGDLTRKGYITRALKPVNWCFSCETALAEAEVEYEDKQSPTVFVKFEVNNPEVLGLPKGERASLIVWTTTPWTLLANVAVAVNKEFNYNCARFKDELFIYEESKGHALFGNAIYSMDEKGGSVAESERLFSIINAAIKGKDLTKLVYTHPFDKLKNCPVVTADYVTKEDGTGLVHTAPGHGADDYQTGLKYKLPVLMPVSPKGVFTSEGAPFAGQHVFKANEQIIADLKERGLLFATDNIQHSYPHCWRCKSPVIFRATEQWFLKIDHDDLRQKLRDAIEKVQWVPPAGRERILGMVNTRPDWCLSRQRHWGVPIPALVCKGCQGQQKLSVAVIEHLADLAKTQGAGIWFEKDLPDLLPKGFKCPDCGGTDFQKAHDILDVWFDSGVSHRAVFHSMMNRPLPADLYLEGSDQHRGWFQSSLIPSVALDGKAPYKGVLTHGFVVDGQGRKMSKSLGNVIKPQELIDSHGADILRLWVAASSYHEDIRISKEIVDRLVDAYRKIRNTARYLLGNLHGFAPDKDLLPVDQLLGLDRWALDRWARVLDALDKAYAAYDFVQVFKSAYSFCNEDLSCIYLDILKDRLYTCATKSRERLSAQTVLYHILDGLTRSLAPVMAFSTQEIFVSSPRQEGAKDVKSVHELEWPAIDPRWVSEEIEGRYKVLMDLRGHVLKALDEKRKAGTIGSGLQAKVVITTASTRDEAYFRSLEHELAPVFIVSQVELKKAAQVALGLSEYFGQTTVDVHPADGIKCSRCWNWRTDVGTHQEHPALCGRCARTVELIV